jgi:hypothetical protein
LDSLTREGIYTYEVYGIQRETFIPLSLAVRQVTVTKPKAPLPRLPRQRAVRIPLHYAEKTSIAIIVYDRATDKKLKTSKHVFDPDNTSYIELFLGEELDSGVNQFLILVSDGKAKEATEFYFDYRNGRFVKE